MRHKIKLVILWLILSTVSSTILADTPMREIRLNPIWSPDGQYIAYMASDGIYLVKADGSDNRLISEPAGFGGWTGDSASVLIIQNQYPAEASIAWWQYPINEDEPQRLLPELDLIHALAYSHDGEQLAISGQMSESEPMIIWVANADGSDLTAIAELNSYDVSWSVDDERVIVRTRLEDDGMLRDANVTISVDDPHTREVTFLSEGDSTVSLSDSVAFRYQEADSYAPLTYFVTDILLDGERLLTLDQLAANIIYDEDTQVVAYTTYCEPDAVSSAFLSGEWSADEQAQVQTALSLLDVASAEVTEVIGCGEGSQMSLTFSPDGQHIAYVGIKDAQWHVYRLDVADASLHDLMEASASS